MNNSQQDTDLQKSNTRVALFFGAMAIASLCLAAYGISKSLAVQRGFAMNELNQDPQQETGKRSTKRTVATLALVTILMFGFAFAMVPLYRLVCSVTGINSIATNSGRTLAENIVTTTDTVSERNITVQFDATINGNVAWEFRPSVRSIVVKPGEKTTISYYVKNHSDEAVVTQSIPGVTPWQATKHLKKIECFCFDTQTLQAGEAKDMGLQFVIDPELPDDISTITLSYTIMDTNRSESLTPNTDNIPTVGSDSTASNNKNTNS